MLNLLLELKAEMRDMRSQFRNMKEVLNGIRSSIDDNGNQSSEPSLIHLPLKSLGELQAVEEQLSQDIVARRQLVSFLLNFSTVNFLLVKVR